MDLPEVVFAKDQPEYLQLPAIVSNDTSGRVTTRWRLGWKERLRLLFSGNLYVQVLTFHKSLQPIKLMVDCPPVEDCL